MPNHVYTLIGGAKRANVTVNPTTTVLLSSTPVGTNEQLYFELINDDVSQSLSAQIEVSADGNAPWYVTNYSGAQSLAAGGIVSDVIGVIGYGFVRVTGTASGAGLTARKTFSLIGDP